jgi:two-component SAPR family response regulator
LLERLEREANDASMDALVGAYRARFALDFAYNEWTSSYRDTLHAAYLDAVASGIRRRIAIGRPAEGAAIARRALVVDHHADHIERLLMASYHAANAHAAVREQYAHYAAAIREELGVEAPSLAELIARGFETE